MNKKIRLPRTIVNQILEHAQSSPEDEICGLISSADELPCKCYPIKNIADNTETRYQMDPAEQINAMRDMRDNHEKLFAIYHSHPNSEAIPSVTDIMEACYPDTFYLIVSLNTKGVLEMRAYTISSQEVSAVVLELE